MWIYFMYTSGKEPRGGPIKKDMVSDWKNLLLVTFKAEKTDLFLLPVEPVSNGTRLPIGVSGDTTRAHRKSVTHCSGSM